MKMPRTAALVRGKPGPKTADGDGERITVALVLSRETAGMLAEMARATDMSRSRVVRMLIREKYEHHRVDS